MERLLKSDRAYAIAAAAAQDLNDELTVILSSVGNCIHSLEPGHPARPLLREAQLAAKRCAGMASTILSWSERKGVRPGPSTVARLVDIDALL